MLSEFNKLSPEQQQQVIDFIEFLRSKSTQQESLSNHIQPLSAYEAAKKWSGSVDTRISDLSTNKSHLEGFGEK